MRRRTNATNKPFLLRLGLLLLVLTLLTGCLPEASSGNNGRTRFSEIPTIEPVPGTEPTPTPDLDTPDPAPEFVVRLLDPGSTLDPTQRVFFRNGRDFWEISSGEANNVLPPGTRFGPYATSPHGQRAAIVIISDNNGQQVETVHVIANGALGPPLIPERVTSGNDAQPSIQGLAWSRDATKIAIVYDAPAVDILEIARADGSAPAIITEIRLPEEYRRVQRAEWSINSAALAILAEMPSGTGSLWMASVGGELYEVAGANIGGQRSINDITWLPGRGRIAFVEERTRTSAATGGSMFSIAPDGSGRELMVSAGNFAPSAELHNIHASPGGSYVAFTVNVPNANGVRSFDSAWIVNIDSGITSRIPVTSGFRVTDIWWTTEGVLWRAAFGQADDPALVTTYTGVEPFIIGLFNPDSGDSSIQFQSDAD